MVIAGRVCRGQVVLVCGQALRTRFRRVRLVAAVAMAVERRGHALQRGLTVRLRLDRGAAHWHEARVRGQRARLRGVLQHGPGMAVVVAGRAGERVDGRMDVVRVVVGHGCRLGARGGGGVGVAHARRGACCLVVGGKARGVRVVGQSEVHLRVERVELVEPTVGAHHGGFLVTVGRRRMESVSAWSESESARLTGGESDETSEMRRALGRRIAVGVSTLPQNLVRADNDRLLRTVIGVLDLQDDMHPCPAVRGCLHAEEKNAGALLFGLGDEPVLRLGFAQMFPVDEVVPRDSLQ